MSYNKRSAGDANDTIKEIIMSWKLTWTVLCAIGWLLLLMTLSELKSSNDSRNDYEARYEAFLKCKINDSPDVCSDLLN